MSSRTVYTCDRCHKDGVPGIYHVDMGNDYTSPRGTDPKSRVMVDLCSTCYSALLDWVHEAQLKAKGGK
jgi:hypothetical protein